MSTHAARAHLPPFHWHFLTPVYDPACSLMGLGEGFRAMVLDLLAPVTGERILDAGCGTGALLISLKKGFPCVMPEGLDPDEHALRIASRKLDAGRLRIPLHLASMSKMPFADCSFDAVVSTLAFHHVAPEERAASLAECLRVLRDGGRLLLADLSPGPRPAARLVFRLLAFFERLDANRDLSAVLGRAGFAGVREVGRRLGAVGVFIGRKTTDC